MIRYGEYSISYIEDIMKELVLNNLVKPKFVRGTKHSEELTVMIDGEKIKALSDRYKLFFSKGYKCVACGIQGDHFVLEKNINDKSYHLNLYATGENNSEILMTKDHIVPKSKGGLNRLENYQVMCTRCNLDKGNAVEPRFETGKWYPIEDVPQSIKDCELDILVGKYDEEYGEIFSNGFYRGDYCKSSVIRPTHWMLIPSVPKIYHQDV